MTDKAKPTADPAPNPALPRFWRDQALPFIEARSIGDGRKACYARHSHEIFSVGVVSGGRSRYLHGNQREQVGAGAVVLMNPADVHACNPIENEPWSYRMLYVDPHWLTGLQHELGFSRNRDFRAFSTAMTMETSLYAGFNRFYETLTDPQAEHLQKECAAVGFFTRLQQTLDPAPVIRHEANARLERAADFIRGNCVRPLTLDQICREADLSASYLIRAFKQRYHMTPHAFLLNRRIEFARSRLRQGSPIAAVALDAGFADQAHFQRVFKQFLAATPGQYRG